MDNTYYMLNKIREKPSLYLGKKSLEALSHFKGGYAWGRAVEAWERSTNRDFFENYEEAMRLAGNECESIDWWEFTKYVHIYYNETIGAKGATMLILENSKSDEDAFNKFFELFDMFIKEH